MNLFRRGALLCASACLCTTAAWAQSTAAQYSNGDGSHSGSAVILCPSATPGQSAACSFSSPTPLTGVQSAAVESNHVLKSSAGTLYAIYVTPQATAGYLMTFDATSAPADGAVTPKECIPISASTAGGIAFSGLPAGSYATGIVAVYSTTGCFTKTASSTAFFKAVVQ